MKIQHALIGAVLGGLSLPALAHSGDSASGFWQGVIHPLTGLDHLAAIVCLGVWLSTMPRGLAVKSIMAVAALFFGSIVLAGNVEGAPLQLLEMAVLVSVAIVGLLAVTRAQLGALTPAIAAAIFTCHGLAHGTEAAAAISSFATGSTLSLVALVVGVYALGLATPLFRSKWA